MPKLIGLDLGTTTIGGVLLDTVRAEALRAAGRRNDSSMPPGLPTRAEQDPQRGLGFALEVLAELVARGLPVRGIGLRA